MVEQYDIAVVGGGAAGMIAAWTAAHRGARVVLIEGTPKVGGMVQYGMHRWMCGLFPCDVHQPDEFLHGKGVEQFCWNLVHGDPRTCAVRRGRVWLLPIPSGTAFSACAHDMLASESSLNMFLSERVCAAQVVHGNGKSEIQALQLESGKTIEARAFIDCTGNAGLCRMADASIEVPEHPALGGYGIHVEGVRATEVSPFGMAIDVPRLCRQEAEQGVLPAWCAFTTCEAMPEEGCAWLRMAVPGEVPLEHVRTVAHALFQMLKQQLPMFRHAVQRMQTPYVLLREGSRVRGRYCLTGVDVLRARKMEDAVARSSWPIERWDADKGVRYVYLPEGAWHDIPARSLQPEQGPINLLCAGMMISADREAQASVRVTGTCMATGEASAKMALSFLV
ncbi:MAG: FAD-dependent oxidoreductase [bacterium]